MRRSQIGEPYKVTSWRELSDVFLAACTLSDPATADPFGVATFDRIEKTNIVRLKIEVDLIPIPK